MKGQNQNHSFILFRRENSMADKKQSSAGIVVVAPKYAHINPDGGYTGLDLGEEKVITKIRYLPMLNVNYTMLGGRFQGSNESMESGYEDIYTIAYMPHMGWNEANIYVAKPYRFVRYYGPDGCYSMVSKIEYYTLESDSQTGETREVKLKGRSFEATPEDPGNDPAKIYEEGPDVLLTFKNSARKTGCPFQVHSGKQGEVFSHQHDFVEFIYIQKGSCFHFYNGEIVNLYAGDFLVIPPGTDHYYFGGVNLTMLNILTYPEEMGDACLSQLSSLPYFSKIFRAGADSKSIPFIKFHLRIENQIQIIPLLKEMEMELTAKERAYQAACHNLFVLIMIQLERLHQFNHKDESETDDSAARYKLMAQTMQILENNFATIDNVEEIVCSLPVGYSWLAHLFKEETGLSVYDFLLRIRIGQACVHLIKSRDDISRISSAVGFTNYSNFSRKFKQLVGYTPLEFRHRFFYAKAPDA
ncbi:MAG: AraC family transcriptional regulator [Bacillota bacterium]